MELICKKCGNTDLFYIKKSYKCIYHSYIRGDGYEFDDDISSFGGSSKTISKYVYCSNCNKKVCKIEDLDF